MGVFWRCSTGTERMATVSPNLRGHAKSVVTAERRIVAVKKSRPHFFGGSVTVMVSGRLGMETSVFGLSGLVASLLKGTWAWPRTASV